MNVFSQVFLLLAFCNLDVIAQEVEKTSESTAAAAQQLNLNPSVPTLPLVTQDDRVRSKLSTLWTVEALNIIGADVLSSFIPGKQVEIEKFAGGKDNVKYFMLFGTAVYEIPIGMILLSRYLPYKVNRWTNISAAAVTAILVLGGGSLEPHYIAMASVQTLTLSYIAWTAFQWPNPKAMQDVNSGAAGGNNIRLQFNPNTGRYGLNYAFAF